MGKLVLAMHGIEIEGSILCDIITVLLNYKDHANYCVILTENRDDLLKKIQDILFTVRQNYILSLALGNC